MQKDILNIADSNAPSKLSSNSLCATNFTEVGNLGELGTSPFSAAQRADHSEMMRERERKRERERERDQRFRYKSFLILAN